MSIEVTHLAGEDLESAHNAFRSSVGYGPISPERLSSIDGYWDADRTLVAKEGGRLVAVAAPFPSRVSAAGGGSVPACAVCSVGVVPDRQGRGIGRTLLERQLREAVAADEAVAVLNASEAVIYGRFGYAPVTTSWTVQLRTQGLAWAHAPDVGTVDLVDADVAEAQLPAAYGQAFGAWPGELDRHAGWWPFGLRRTSAHPMHIAVLRDRAGATLGGATFTREQRDDAEGPADIVTIDDLFGTSSEAELTLVRWVASMRLVRAVRIYRMNPGSPLPLALSDPRRLVTHELGEGMWARILDVPRVVSSRATLADGAVTVAVRDPLVAGNNRTFRIAGSDGVLACDPAGDRAAALTIPIDRLATLCWSLAPASRLADAGLIDVHDPAALPALDRLLAWPIPPHNSTRF